MPDPNMAEEDFLAWQVLRRVNSVGLLWNRPSDAWLGIPGFKSAQRDAGFKLLSEADKLESVTVEEIDHPLFLDRANLALLAATADTPVPWTNIRFIAPLDNLMWDRKLIRALTGFDYRWEVYTPAAKRRYGYYVLPVLAGDRFVGRIELATDQKTLVIKDFWWENNIRARGMLSKSILAGLKRFAKYNHCVEIRGEEALKQP
jgi:uncharacterized protein YcaQ